MGFLLCRYWNDIEAWQGKTFEKTAVFSIFPSATARAITAHSVIGGECCVRRQLGWGHGCLWWFFMTEVIAASAPSSRRLIRMKWSDCNIKCEWKENHRASTQIAHQDTGHLVLCLCLKSTNTQRRLEETSKLDQVMQSDTPQACPRILHYYL